MHQLRTEGVLSDLTKMTALLSVAKQYVITDAGWNLLDFAAQMRGLTSGNLVFRTLPIKGYATIDGQDANVVDPACIQAIVHAAFYPEPSRGPPGIRGRAGSRGRRDHRGCASTAVTRPGWPGASRPRWPRPDTGPGAVGNTGSRTTTAVRYGAGASANAGRIAAMFGVTAVASASARAGHVEILLGASATLPNIAAPAAATPSPGTPSV